MDNLIVTSVPSRYERRWNKFQLPKVVIVERGCAQQSYQHQALVRGKWRTVTTVLEEVSLLFLLSSWSSSLLFTWFYKRSTQVGAWQIGSGLVHCLQTRSTATARRINATTVKRRWCWSGWTVPSNNLIIPQEGDFNTAEAVNGTDFNSTETSSELYLEPESLPHPRNTRLFYNMMRSGCHKSSPILTLLLMLSRIFEQILRWPK